MGRPWLSQDEFNIPVAEINEKLEQNLQAEINDKFFYTANFDLAVKDKAYGLKKYYYENIYFDNYGEPIHDSLNNLIGYKLNETEKATVHTFFDKINL